MTGEHDTQVAVVGFGPVGALAALLLGRAGVSCTVLDRREAVHPLPRAVAADDEVLRLLAAAGLEEAVARMVGVPGATFLGRSGEVLLEVDFDGGRSGRPGLALFRQPDLEGELRERVLRLPTVQTRLGQGVVGLAQDADGVTLTLDGGGRLRAAYVLGCDGANSTVRDLLGIGARGCGAGQRWLVVDVRTEDRVPVPPRVTYHCDPTRTTVVMPTPGGRRLEFLLEPGAPTPAPHVVDALLAPHLADVAADVERIAAYDYRVRRARRWAVRRVLLAGDAAHTMPPFAGQGLAAGFRDVSDLAWRLPLVLSGLATPALLAGYERERRPHVGRMTALSRTAGAVLTTRSQRRAVARDAVLAAAVSLPAVRAWLRAGGPRPRQALGAGGRRLPLGGRRLRHRGGKPLGLLPDARVALRPGGPVTRLDGHLAGRFTLLAVGVPRPDLSAEAEAVRDALAIQVLRVVDPAGAGSVAGEAGVLLDIDDWVMPVVRGRLVLVRPDRQVVALASAPAAVELLTWLARSLGCPLRSGGAAPALP